MKGLFAIPVRTSSILPTEAWWLFNEMHDGKSSELKFLSNDQFDLQLASTDLETAGWVSWTQQFTNIVVAKVTTLWSNPKDLKSGQVLLDSFAQLFDRLKSQRRRRKIDDEAKDDSPCTKLARDTITPVFHVPRLGCGNKLHQSSIVDVHFSLCSVWVRFS